jgi:hypothetical protein
MTLPLLQSHNSEQITLLLPVVHNEENEDRVASNDIVFVPHRSFGSDVRGGRHTEHDNMKSLIFSRRKERWIKLCFRIFTKMFSSL